MNEDAFEKLARLISESHDDLAARIDEVETSLGDRISGLEVRIDTLQTEMREGFRDIRSQLSDIEKRLRIVEEQTASNSGFAKEIDMLRDEIRAIKKHLGFGEVIPA